MNKKNTELSKVDKILKQESITKESYEHLNDEETEEFFNRINQFANQLEGKEREDFFQKIEPITSNETKNQIWENNHIKITSTIANLMHENKRMPTQQEVANNCGLSRNTVVKHMSNFKADPVYIEQIEQYKLMVDVLLSRLFTFGCQGDVKAAKLYFEMMGLIQTKSTNNNFIVVNNTVIRQELIQELEPETILDIETAIKKTIPRILE